MKTKTIILALAIGASSNLINAQDAPPPRPPGGDRPAGERPPGDQPRGERPPGERPPGERPRGEGPPRAEGRPGQGFRPVSPIIEALDLNKDGTIDADELAKASESLKKLDKNGDGKITEEEFRPMRPQGQGGPDAGPPRGRGEDRPPGAPGGEPRGEPRPPRPELEK